MLNPIKFFKDKMQAFRVAQQSAAYKELAFMKNNGETNTYVPAKERSRRKKRKQIAKQSRRQNRK
ncbi:hypothetical protein [Bacillus sp. ISL-7]|uniref:hypothetical protein n=1 Tax=Bacillus sp. ISL-7 TaxID=2819136 RepID=UPI001BEB0FF5|nr:hypothetical protein [Bacillus sp. ISL-7]MBT2735174.1 hypothetical protein [Bacillus sp. ISL-7]